MLHGSLHTAQAWKAAGKALPANKKYKSLVVQYYDISNLQVASLRSLIDPRVGLVGRLLWRSSTVVLRLHLLDRSNRAHQWLGWTSAASQGVSTGVILVLGGGSYLSGINVGCTVAVGGAEEATATVLNT